MTTNADCTIYHKIYNPATRLDEWEPSQYQGVNWYGKQAVSVGDSGLSTADSYIVRIPTEGRIPVDKGDVVVKGLIQDTITNPSQLKQYESFLVTAVRDNRRGSPMMRLNKNGSVQKYVDSEALRLSSPYVPFKTGNLDRSGIRGTNIGSGEVIYNAPYSSKQYNTATTRSYDAQRGGLWFERMKIDHKEEIMRGAKKLSGGK